MAEQIEAELKQLRAEVFAEISEADLEATLRVLDALYKASGAASAAAKLES